MTTCRWGFVSTAEIGKKNWQAIRLSGNGIVAAVASRDAGRSQAFIDECQRLVPFERPPRAYGSYEELIESPDIDAVYVPLPTGLRKEQVIAAARAGKHVLCEKPCAPSFDDLQEMTEACRSANVQFMDGVMYMHTKRLAAMRKALDDGTSVGKVRRITAQFSFCADEKWLSSNIRLDSGLEPQGCLGDLGWYCIRFALWVMNYRMPGTVSGRILTERKREGSPQAVPLEFSAEMVFGNSVSASFYCSFITHHQQWANVSGDHGYLHVNDFVLPYDGPEAGFDVSNATFDVDGCDFVMKDHRRHEVVREPSNSAANSMETNLFRNFAERVNSGSPDWRWVDYALKTQEILDACLKSAREKKPVSLSPPVVRA